MLERQVEALQAVGVQLEDNGSAQRAHQSVMSTIAQARSQALEVAHASLAACASQVDSEVQALRQVASELGDLLGNQPGQWLLSATDLSSYYQAVATCHTQTHR